VAGILPAVTDATSATPDPVIMPEPAGDAVAAQEICPCCGLELPEGGLAGLVTEQLPVIPSRPAPAAGASEG
jgi:hypothetical protein